MQNKENRDGEWGSLQIQIKLVVISTETLGPRCSSLSREGNGRKVERSVGGGEDSTGAGS